MGLFSWFSFHNAAMLQTLQHYDASTTTRCSNSADMNDHNTIT
ncbi:MAG: hypothetical protein OEM77_07785 [Nitrosopumilus sp.]|nr:hypothetical protein [Nitrosopumilus sp.]